MQRNERWGDHAIFRPFYNFALTLPQHSLFHHYPAALLRRDWAGIYEWATAAYEPEPSPGKITFVWDEVDLWRRVGWREIAAVKGDDVETYIITGDHYTCRTDHLHELASYVRNAIAKAPMPV